MIKILFCGVYRDGTGWGHAAIDYILALDTVGIDVVCRPIKLNELPFDVPERIKELECKPLAGTDVLIQHILPHMMEYSGYFNKNVALVELETDRLGHTFWPEYINTMDELWVTSNTGLQACDNSYINIPTKLALHTTDISKYNKEYLPLEIPETDGDFIFYTILDINTRKNLVALLRAFHSEFDPDEPVSLVIKATKYGLGQEVVLEQLQNFAHSIKQGLNVQPKTEYYKQEIFVPNVVTDEMVYRLHNSCDCFVLPSCGEAWCIPAFDAMGFGKTPIVTNWGGFTDYMTNDTGWLVDCHLQQAFGGGDTNYTGLERWASVDVMNLRKCMREAYSNSTLREQKAKAGKVRVQDFSYDVIGNNLKRMLENND